jgi:hypothetical protein
LVPLGVTEVPMPMTPMRVWQAIERAREERGGPAPATGAEPSLPNGSQAGTLTPLGRGTKGDNNA